MNGSPRLVVIGLSITSSWGNGHATTYRSLVAGLSGLGYRTLFLERDAPWYASNRDAPQPRGCQVALYDSPEELRQRHAAAVRSADVVIVGSYVPDGAEVAHWVTSTARGAKLFYDIDTPVTIARLRAGNEEYLARHTIPRFDAYLSFTGGPALEVLERSFGAQVALPLYCSASIESARKPVVSLHPTLALGYLGTYSPDRQGSVDRLLLEPAKRLPEMHFQVAGSCYPDSVDWPANVTRIEHLSPREHRAFYRSARFTLNVTRADMIAFGYSPSVRLFEAAAYGTPVITDEWSGIERFFEPGKEILLASSTEEVEDILVRLGEDERRAIGARAQRRVFGEHTGAHRAVQLHRYIDAIRKGQSPSLSPVLTERPLAAGSRPLEEP